MLDRIPSQQSWQLMVIRVHGSQTLVALRIEDERLGRTVVPAVAPLATEMTGVFFTTVTLVAEPPTRETFAVGIFLAGFGVGFLAARRRRLPAEPRLSLAATFGACGRSATPLRHARISCTPEAKQRQT